MRLLAGICLPNGTFSMLRGSIGLVMLNYIFENRFAPVNKLPKLASQQKVLSRCEGK